ncbi:MAG: biotin synthase BioB, partial [Acidovorax sp.]|nr:biotin synthase BioB [Acidovorax sp.]
MSGFTTPSAAATPQAVQLHRRPAAMPQPAGPWSVEAIQALLDKPLMDLLFEAQ